MCGKQLWKWTADAALDSGVFTHVVCSSDGGFDTDYYRDAFIDNDRIPALATDAAPLDPLLGIYAERYFADIVCLLQPTSPLRDANDIRNAYYCLCLNDFDSVVSVTSVGDKYWTYRDGKPKAFYDPMNRLNRQDERTNVLFYENGAIYFTKSRYIFDGCRIGGKVGLYEMPQNKGHQVDSEYDWKVCEAILGC